MEWVSLHALGAEFGTWCIFVSERWIVGMSLIFNFGDTCTIIVVDSEWKDIFLHVWGTLGSGLVGTVGHLKRGLGIVYA